MTSIKRKIRAQAAIAAMLTLSLPSLTSAQGRFGGGPAYTPEEGATDLKSVLFNWAWHLGMLRSTEEYDLVMTLRYDGEGTMQVGGALCNVSLYRSDISYRDSGERIRITGTRPNGQDCSTIEVLSGGYTWNEDIMGAELVPGEGTATPIPATVVDRMIRLWTNPQGAWKSAMAGTQYPEAPDLTGRPGQLQEDVMSIGRTSVEWDSGQPVVTFPIPGVPGAVASATLDELFMPESVVVENGNDTYEFTYSDYRDWNNPLHPAEAFYAGTMREVKNGTVVRDITTTMTETGQMYVVIPVPASVMAAITPTHQPLDWTLTDRNGDPAGYDAPVPQFAADAPTPRTADGKPDLTGNWGRSPNPITGSGNRRCGPMQLPGGGVNPEVGCYDGRDRDSNWYVDYAWISPSRFGVLGLPTYKPEHWDRVQELDMWTNRYDPIMTCKPIGIPRHGTPNRIVQTDYDIIMFYGANADYGGGNNEYRDVPIDGRELTDQQLSLTAFYGQSVGRWEGDTLVIESINFDDGTWLGRGGFFHSTSMRTTERLTRVGNELHYDITVEDPEVLLEPWVLPTRVLRLSNNNRVQAERANCEVYEDGNTTSQVRH